ncbi:MAG TPA: Sec-independent protein translocase subunit TatA [Pseudonocardia sp.]|jgi:sec-independent protein translocase protein TatA|uniref:Sec-independent protein translocase subunit TatA n=1 Tax=Pseudonocardia sp. TaxID=60912 RepID=UPI002BB8E81D|nr:Sec-independent protein translocase subunit TatA [Pseudonocardia sp.]HTF53051.1 Sec-independent protein translocase subunit TatA [Pseudonocardia sp.]
MPGGWEWVILLVVVLLLFGAKRLPEMARSLGRSARVLRSELKGMGTDDDPAEKKPSAEHAEPVRAQAALPSSTPAESSAKPSAAPEPVTGPSNGVAPGHSNGSAPINGIGPANGTEPATGHPDRG